MISKSNTRGFTLIELLVVIAIIGILASVVLASLNSARDKGEDAAIKSNLNNARAQAEMSYDDNARSYDVVCSNTSTQDPQGILDLITAATAAGGGAAAADCDDSATAWAAEKQLSNTEYYCVDSTGAAVQSAGSKGAAATVCP
jgi:prepilin-type N-terminal cleavage/methylation domain-containing protein